MSQGLGSCSECSLPWYCPQLSHVALSLETCSTMELHTAHHEAGLSGSFRTRGSCHFCKPRPRTFMFQTLVSQIYLKRFTLPALPWNCIPLLWKLRKFPYTWLWTLVSRKFLKRFMLRRFCSTVGLDAGSGTRTSNPGKFTSVQTVVPSNVA